MITTEQKIRIKRLVRSVVGEPYVGKRMKLRYLNALLPRLDLKDVEEILEVGCSDGLFSEWIQKRFPNSNVTALDIDKENIEALSTVGSRIDFQYKDVLDLKQTNLYDLVLALDVLEHIENDSLALQRIFDALKVGGTLIVHVPNRIYRTMSGQIYDVPDEDAWKINPGHVRNGYIPADLRAKLEQARFEVVQIFTAHGVLSDLAHTVYKRLEHPTPLRIASIPLVEVLSLADRTLPRNFGNTVFAVAVKSS